jgi:adenosylhomocysteine nucleosidase
MNASAILVTFALREEAGPFLKRFGKLPGITIVFTGMGARNARRSIEASLEKECPSLVLTCGSAGGLTPELASGTVVFSKDASAQIAAHLTASGARPVRFFVAERVAVTASEKRSLYEATGADAVEMESGVIQEVCKARNVPCATVRVILDSVDQDLPLDFNRLTDSEDNMDYRKLAVAILCAPGKIPALMRLQRQSQGAAKALAEVLGYVIEKIRS